MFRLKTRWDKTPNFKYNAYLSLMPTLESICGDLVYGKYLGKQCSGYRKIIAFLEKAVSSKYYTDIPYGHILTHSPTPKDCVDYLTIVGQKKWKFYSKRNYWVDVIDRWVPILAIKKGSPLNLSKHQHYNFFQHTQNQKRFVKVNIPIRQRLIHDLKNCQGILAETYVVSFLNSNIKCPECKSIGMIGWCGNDKTEGSDSFRDAICLSCRAKGIITLFEIKTRWDRLARRGNGTYAGNFVSLNTLMAMGANIYIVIASKDTGHVRIGKITFAKIRATESWLYFLQENANNSSPASYVVCDNGFTLCKSRMVPINQLLSNSIVKDISRQVIKNMKL